MSDYSTDIILREMSTATVVTAFDSVNHTMVKAAAKVDWRKDQVCLFFVVIIYL